MKIRDFITRFKNEDELKLWLKQQKKDYLYSLYMQDTNYDGVGSRYITRNQLKDMFLEEYIKYEVEEIKKCVVYKKFEIL